MKIIDNTIYFISTEEMYNKERDGLKSNTVRILSEEESKEVMETAIDYIIIIKKGSEHYFTRWITDISYLYNSEYSIYVFSWSNK